MRSVLGVLPRPAWPSLLLGFAVLTVGLCAALTPSLLTIVLAAIGGLGYVAFAAASIRRPLVFVATFLLVLEILPPFFFPSLGETPVYVSTILIPVGLAVLVVRLPEFDFQLDSVGKGLLLFLAAIGASLPFAWWFCGAEVAASSLFRWLLLGQALLIYLLVRGGAEAAESRLERRMFSILLVAALISAAYGILDFAQPVPLPHPAADQFIWLRGAVLRRAQGVFYESSNFANFCGFSLAAVSALLLAREKRVLDIPWPLLLLAIAILSLAVLVAFSRSAWASVLTTVIVFVRISRRVAARRAAVFLAALAIPILGLWLYSPELWDYLVNARVGYLAQILSDPNMASSGRVETWQRMFSILQDYPRYLVFGTGYKTLPYTRLFHDQLIPDNGYLSLLLETGVVGLGAFLAFTGAILRTFWTLHKRVGPLGFWSALLFSFWCGECVQLLAADAHTYWRNMIVFAAFMALALNRAEREQALPSNLARSSAAGSKGQATP